MKYSDLFTLNPIETVIKIDEAGKKKDAIRLVDTFVITQTLGEQIENVALPQLDFNASVEGKGIFIVGNYGTGKSHVMSFLSIIAENEDYLQHLRDVKWQNKLRPFAGKYKVRRLQIAGSLMTLYDIITEQLSLLAKDCGFDFTFKDQSKVSNIKNEFQRFMEQFDSLHPNKGVLLVVDELLHYLETRKNDQDMAIDLSVLQSLGEFCDNSRFVFMAGLQQSLFNNPRFNHVASIINRIRQRFYDFVIDSKGVAQLIEQYLFYKTDAQKQQIRDLFQPLFNLFEVLPSKIDQFISLFPAHPDFIDEFQRVFVVERREILTVLTKEARKRLDLDASADRLDLITADDYWSHIEVDQGLFANKDVSKVKRNVTTIRAHIQSDFKATEDKESALRLIYALAVNRLTTPSINDTIGLTPKELKNNLLWRTSIPIQDADFLSAEAKRLLDRTRESVNGQFLSVSEGSGQYYIDPNKERDYDQLVENYAKVSISKDVIQRYLNEMFTRALELENEQPVISGRLWEYNTLTWAAKNVARPGWLFFGFPNQRSTANPPKDFYLFIIPSHRITGISEEWSDIADELYWLIEDFDDNFLQMLTKYASAKELAGQSRGDDKKAYDQISQRFLDPTLRTFVDNSAEWISIRWNGQMKRFGKWVQELTPSKETSLFKTRLESISEVMLESHFDSKFPNYPVFEIKINENTRAQNAQSALDIICKHGMETDAGRKVLKALRLYDEGAPTPDVSPWLGIIRKELKVLDPGQVLNNSDLFEKREDRIFMRGESIEAEWLHVVLAAGVEAGDLVVIGLNNMKYGAANLIEFYKNINIPEKIIRIALPAEIPISEWRKLFKLLKVNEGLLANPSTYKEGLEIFQAELFKRVQHLVQTKEKLKGNLLFAPDDTMPNKLVDISVFEFVKLTLESLANLNSRAKMQNLKLTSNEINQLSEHINQCEIQERILRFFDDMQIKLSAIRRYEDILGAHTEFKIALDDFKKVMAEVYANPGTVNLDEVKIHTDDLARLALNTYQTLKKRYTLDKNGDKRKKLILEGNKLKTLNKLAMISVLNKSKLEQVWKPLEKMPVNQPCTDDELLKSPTGLCPYTKFDPRPFMEDDAIPAIDALTKCEEDLDIFVDDWTKQLLNELNDPAIRSTLTALKPSDKLIVDEFLQNSSLPSTVDDAFVKIINEALSGLKTRPVKAISFTKQIFGDGLPLKEAELRERFESWLKTVKGKDSPESIRFILED
ncbi:MAG: DUF6079 family protein [Armatimonadota bacterium]